MQQKKAEIINKKCVKRKHLYLKTLDYIKIHAIYAMQKTCIFVRQAGQKYKRIYLIRQILW